MTLEQMAAAEKVECMRLAEMVNDARRKLLQSAISDEIAGMIDDDLDRVLDSFLCMLNH